METCGHKVLFSAAPLGIDRKARVNCYIMSLILSLFSLRNKA